MFDAQFKKCVIMVVSFKTTIMRQFIDAVQSEKKEDTRTFFALSSPLLFTINVKPGSSATER